MVEGQTKYFSKTLSQNRLPQGLVISPLPQEILSYITSILQSLPAETQQQEELKTNKIALDVCWNEFLVDIEFGKKTTLSSKLFQSSNKQTILLSAFAEASRDMKFYCNTWKLEMTMMEQTVETTMDNIYHIPFKNLTSLTHDIHLFEHMLQLQFKHRLYNS
jgi:hypothetical protein